MEQDGLYDHALVLINKEENKKRIGTGLIQRYLKIGYNRASVILDQLEENKIIGPSNGAKPRKLIGIGEITDSTISDASIEWETFELRPNLRWVERDVDIHLNTARKEKFLQQLNRGSKGTNRWVDVPIVKE